MNITVQVDQVTLDTTIREATEYGDAVTVGSEVARQLVNHIIGDRDVWPPFRDAVTEFRDAEIRAQVRPLIAGTLTKSLQKTNNFGEPTGQTTTLSEVIIAEAKRLMTQPKGSYGSGRTVLQEMVAAEVKTALGAEIADAVKKAREMVSGQIGEMVAAAVAEGMRKR